MTADTLEDTKSALSQLSGLRERLAGKDGRFAFAAALERDAETFCEKVRTDLKSRRLELGLNQAELAQMLELSQSAISKLESGRGDLGLKTVFRIAAALRLHPVLAFASGASAAVAAQALGADAGQGARTAALVGVVQEELIREIPQIVQAAAARLASEG